MSVNMDVGVSVPAGHCSRAGERSERPARALFRVARAGSSLRSAARAAVDFEADQDAVSLDWVQDLMLGAGVTLGVLVSCALSVLVFLN
jgi:hypothetical protein